VAQLIDHSVGLAGISPLVTLKILHGLHGSHTLSSLSAGLESKLGRTIGQYLRDEALVPLQIDDEV